MRKNIRRLIFTAAIVLIASAAAVLASCEGNTGTGSVGDSKSFAERDESIVYVAVSPGNEPFEYIDDDGVWDGFDIALAMKLGEELGRKPVFVNRSEGDIYSSLNCGIAEFAVSALEADDSVRQTADFTSEYITLSSSIVKSVYNLEITNIYALRNAQSIGVVQDSFSDKYLTDELGFENISRRRNFEDAKQALFSRECDVLFIDDYLANEICALSAEFEAVQSGIGEKKYCIAAAKGNSAMIKRLSEILSRFRRDGTLLDLRKAYLGYDLELKEVFSSEVRAVQSK